ncbi:MAG: CRTAC1 family protein [Planctomycetota bacterium]
MRARTPLLIAALALLALACGDDEKTPAKDSSGKAATQGGGDEQPKQPKQPVVPAQPAAPAPTFTNEAQPRGLTGINQTGESGKKQFIMSAIGPGAAVFDANADGRLDIYIPNGNRLVPPYYDKLYAGKDRPRNAFYIQQADGTFRDEAKERGVDCDRWGFGACAADLDNDGDPDLVVANFFMNRLYLNDGKGHFRDVAVEAGIAGAKDEWSTGIAVGDFDKDGIPDLYISNYANMFEWMRTEKMIKRGPKGEILKATVCVWQRLLVYCGPQGLPAQQDHLYRGLGTKDGVPQFEDVSKKSGIHRPGVVETSKGPAYGFQPIFADLNGDDWPDLYVANDSTPSYYFENQKDGTFLECGESRGIAKSSEGELMAGMGADMADLDHDGHADLLKTNFALQTYNIYIGEYFKETMYWREWSVRTGLRQVVFTALGWGGLFFDFDNDGDRDIFFANGHVYPEVETVPELNTRFKQRNHLIRNDLVPKGRLKLRDVTGDAGPGFAEVKSSRGASFLDFDNDGDLDLVVINMNEGPSLLVNKGGDKSGRWVQLRLRGNPAKKVTRDALHAKVKVTGAAGTQHFQIVRGRGFLGNSDPRLHVGLGANPGKVAVEITWPNGDTQKLELTEFDRVIEVEQK